MKSVWLNRGDVQDINIVLEKFPEIERFQLEEIGGNGIGTCLNMIFETEIKGVFCKVSVPIADESSW
jgi:hypothetical protein